MGEYGLLGSPIPLIGGGLVAGWVGVLPAEILFEEEVRFGRLGLVESWGGGT